MSGRRNATTRAVLNAERIARDVIVIGASAGGVTALMQLFSELPADLPAAVGCVLHRGEAPGRLAEVLGRRSALPVREPSHGDVIRPRVIYLAPADYHLLFDGERLAVQRGPREHSTRPAIDPLFRSAAAFGSRVVAALLTGGGDDGVSGMIAISEADGVTLAQDPDDAYMPYMPRNAIRFDHVNGTFTLDELAPLLAALAKGEAVNRAKIPEARRA